MLNLTCSYALKEGLAMNDYETHNKSVWGSIFLGIMVALLALVVFGLGYFIYNSSVNSADEYGTDIYHKFNYSQAVKQCGSRFLNVKWPFFTDSSWKFESMEYNGQQYVVGTCKVVAEGNPEKIDVSCVFQLQGRQVTNAFFAAGGKIYHDGINFTSSLLEEIFGSTSALYDYEEPVL